MQLTKVGLLALLLLPASAVVAGPLYSAVISFGDSLSDTGNAANISEAAGFPLQPLFFLPPAPGELPDLVPDTAYDISRKLTNDGPVWVETVAARLGLAAQPRTVGGTAYAIGGANSTDALPPFVPPENPLLLAVDEQVQWFLTDVGGSAPNDALYTFTVGGNDLRDALTYSTSEAEVFSVLQASLNSVVSTLGQLALAGARDIVFANVPNLGVAPQITLLDTIVPGLANEFTNLGSLYNANLNAGLNQLISALALAGIDLNLMVLDAYGLITDVTDDPASYGFINGSDACLGFLPAVPCANPDGYVFWDGIHPTVAMHQLIAAEALALIPVPTTWLLLIAGLPGVRRLRWRSSQIH